MPNWDQDYYLSLVERFEKRTENLQSRLDDVVEGRITPNIDELTIGSGRKIRAASLFFDICGFTSISNEYTNQKIILAMLNCVIPVVMNIVHDYGGYVEKNTGDGLLALVGVEDEDEDAAANALSIATTSFYALKNIVNPYLKELDIEPVSAKITIDLGTLIVARIGVHKGSAKQERSFLTAIGPSTNLASKLQNSCGENEIWVGDLIKTNAEKYRQEWFIDKTPQGWSWHYLNKPDHAYRIWHYNAHRLPPT